MSAIRISQAINAFANRDHGTSLDGVILHEPLRQVTCDDKSPELVTNGGAGNKIPETRIKAVKTFPLTIFGPLLPGSALSFF